MLSVRPKITDLNFHLFARSLHPELFQVCAARTYTRDLYELKLSITTDGHLISFKHGDFILAEVSASACHPLPSQRVLLAHPIEKSNDNITRFEDLIDYRSSVQMENVNPKIFVSIQQQLDEKLECEGLVHRFHSNGRIACGAVSYMNVQSFKSHVLIRSFHTFPDSCAVLKSESRFTLNV